MRSDIQIIPTILATSEDEYRQEAYQVSQTSEFTGGWVQIDLMDGQFVASRSVDLEVVAKYPINSEIKKETHLMVSDPLSWIDGLVKLGFSRVIFPMEVEATEEIIKKVKEAGLEVGLALNPETPVAKIEPFIDTIDTVLLMSVHPGFGGQNFMPEVLSKVREAAKLQEGKHFLIEVDGGINEGDEKDLIEAGANILAVGERLTHGDIKQNLAKLKRYM